MSSVIRQALARARRGGVHREPPDEGWADFHLDSDFVGFAGHFPGRPILPAIIHLLSGILVAEALTGRPLRLESIDRAKFTALVVPGDTITVRVKLARPAEGKRNFKARVTIDRGRDRAATMTLELSPRTEVAELD